MTSRRIIPRNILFGGALLLLLLGPAAAQDTDEYFKQNCASCHTIGGGPLSGPDLKDVEDRRDRAWLTRFIMEPQAVIDGGDAYARKLVETWRGVVMPTAAGMDRNRARKLLDLIAAESKLERSRFAGVSLSDRAFTEQDVADGRALFTGERRLAGHGPSCLSCHAVSGLSALGGGLLGPDLSDAYARLGGRKALGAWLAAPPTETMAPVYKKHPIDQDAEILPLLAFMKDAAERGGHAEQDSGIEFLVLGIIGAVIALLLCDAIWRRRFTSVRKSLVGERT